MPIVNEVEGLCEACQFSKQRKFPFCTLMHRELEKNYNLFIQMYVVIYE